LLFRFSLLLLSSFLREPTSRIKFEREDPFAARFFSDEDWSTGDVLTEEGAEVLDELVRRVCFEARVGGGTDVDEEGD
jgi:hypothetical protein